MHRHTLLPESCIYNFLNLCKTQRDGTFNARESATRLISGKDIDISLSKIAVKKCICFRNRQRHLPERVLDREACVVDFRFGVVLHIGSRTLGPRIHWPADKPVAQRTDKSLPQFQRNRHGHCCRGTHAIGKLCTVCTGKHNELIDVPRIVALGLGCKTIPVTSLAARAPSLKSESESSSDITDT